MTEIAAAIESGIVGQANFLGGLATAILGAMIVLWIQIRLSSTGGVRVRWTWSFWIGALFAIVTIALVFVISGVMIEVVPLLFSFPFDASKEFSAQDFGGTRIGVLEIYSRIQVVTFIGLGLFGGLFVFRNVAAT